MKIFNYPEYVLTLAAAKITNKTVKWRAKRTESFLSDIHGIDKSRKIIGMSGFAGQQILIDLDNKRIIVVNSLYKNYSWKKIVHSAIKN